MSNSLPRAAAATTRDGYSLKEWSPPTRSSRETYVESLSNHNFQKQQIPQPPPKHEFPPSYSSKKPPLQPQPQPLPEPSVVDRVVPPKNNFLPRSPNNQPQRQQQSPKSNNHMPSSSTQTLKHEPNYSHGTSMSRTISDVNNNKLPSNQPQPQVPIKQNPMKNDIHSSPTSSNLTHQSSQQPRRLPRNETLHPQSKQQPSVEVSASRDDQHPAPKNNNQTTSQQKHRDQPPVFEVSTSKHLYPTPVKAQRNTTTAAKSLNNRNDVGAKPEMIPDKTSINNRPTIDEVSSKELQHPDPKNNLFQQQSKPNLLNTDQQSVLYVRNRSPAQGNSVIPQSPTLQTPSNNNNNQPPVGPSDEPVLAYPDFGKLPPKTKIEIKITLPDTGQPTNLPNNNPSPKVITSASKHKPLPSSIEQPISEPKSNGSKSEKGGCCGCCSIM